MRYTVVFILTALVLSSCSHKNEAMELSRNFFTSLSDTTYGKPNDFYPLYDSLHIEAKSDAVDIEESDITVKNDTIAVRCYNNYTDATGTFKQDSITLFIAKDKESSWYIYDSKGLITMDEDQEWFGRATGALGKKQLNDVALAQRLSKLSDLISEGTEKVSIFKDQNGKCLRFITSPSTNRLSKAMLDRKRRVKLRFLRH